ncbi:flavodoxin domain-containing protein [Thermomonospora echinospora]|nr:flavodoxin domain-containing protein [Thermomonospora echinospora]
MFVLVGYASAHGSTRSIAERIGARLAERGHRVEVADLGRVEHVDRFEAFVLGSAVHRQAWLDAAVDFVDAHRRVLTDRPVWLFSVGMPAAMRRPWRWSAGRERAVASERLLNAIRPVDHRWFGGVLLREHTSWTGDLVVRALGARYGDHRDWARIDEWADEVGRRLAAEALSGHRRRI